MKNTGTLSLDLPSDREVALTRVFKAPRHLVYEAFSKPEILKRWFGPRGWSLITCDVDARVGGRFRFVLRAPDGHEIGMRGAYRELWPPARSVHRSFSMIFRATSGYIRLYRAGWLYDAGCDDSLSVQGNPRCSHQERYGARRRGKLRQARGNTRFGRACFLNRSPLK